MADMIATDTSESTSDLDDGLAELNLIDRNQNTTKSLFDISLTQFDLESHISDQTESYKAKLKEEQKLWEILLRTSKMKLTELKQPQVRINESLLSEKDRNYLRKAPSLANFLRESIEFRKEANQFLDKVEELLHIQRNILISLEIRQRDKQINKLSWNLANRTNKKK